MYNFQRWTNKCSNITYFLFRKSANAAMLSNYEVRQCLMCHSFTLNLFLFLVKRWKEICYFVSQVFKLLTDLKEQRKDSGKKHSAGQQNLNTIMYEVGSHPLHLFTDSNLLYKVCCVNRTVLRQCAHSLSLHFHTDTEVLVKDILQQTESRDCKRVPHHHDAAQTHKVSVVSHEHRYHIT